MDWMNLVDGPSAAIVLGGTLVATVLRSGFADCALALAKLAQLGRNHFDAAKVRAELAPQVVQAVGDGIETEDVVECIDDESCGLMTTPTTETSATLENHCATETEMCLSGRLLVHRVVDEDCKGGSDARKGVINRRVGSNQIDREYEKIVYRDKDLRGHPSFVCRFGNFVQSRSRGGACFSTVCSHRLSIYTSTHRSCSASSFSDFP